MLDNIGGMILMASLLVGGFELAADVRADPDDPGDGRRRPGRRPDLHGHGLSAGPADRPDRRHRHAAGPRYAQHLRGRLFDHRSGLSGCTASEASIPNRGTPCLVYGHFDAAGLGDFQTRVCAVEWMDPTLGSASRTARFVDSDCTGLDQFSAVLDIAAQPVAGLGGTGPDAGDA